VIRFVAPCIFRVENFGWYIGARLWYEYTEVRMGDEILLRQLPAYRRLHHSPCIPQANPSSCTIGPACPAGVYQPYIDIRTFLQFLSEELCIPGRMQRQEYLSEAGRECCLRFADSDLCPRYLRSVSRQKMVHGLRRRKLSNRRQHAECVAGQEEDVFGSISYGYLFGVFDVRYRIGRPRILGEACVCVVYRVCSFEEAGIFKQRGMLDRGKNFRFFLCAEVYTFRVAAALEVEHGII